MFDIKECETENPGRESKVTVGEQVKVQADEDMEDRGFHDSCHGRGESLKNLGVDVVFLCRC